MKYKKLLTSFFKQPGVTQVVILVILVGIIYFLKVPLDFSNRNTADLATLSINFETEKRVFEGEVVENMTMLDALSTAVSVGKIKLNYTIDKSSNVNILEIDGHINGVSNKYFVFYLNSKKVPQKDLNKTMIMGGNLIEVGLE